MKKPVILYHSSCPDGFGAAYAAWKKFGKRATYIPVERELVLPKGLKGKVVYSLDFVHSEPMISKLLRQAAKVVFIDHHITAKENAKRGDEYLFDLNHSGAVLTWKYFHPGKKVPRLLKYIEEGDLWKFRSPNIHFLLGYVYSQPYEFKVWEKLSKNMEKAEMRRKFIEFGKLISKSNDSIVEGVVEKAELVRFGKYKALAANNSIRNFTSQIGHELCRRKPPIGIIWFRGKNGFRVSLRSNGKADVSKIAEKFGGGGHKRASAFSLLRNAKLPWKTIEK